MFSQERRQFVYIPEIAPDSFLLYFEKKSASTSWSVRDYSQKDTVQVRHGAEFGWLTTEALAKAEFAFPAPVVSATDLNFWHRETLSKNRQYLRSDAPPPNAAFPVLNFQELAQHRSKAELARIVSSPRSSAWLMWNFFELHRQVQPDTWLQHLLSFSTAPINATEAHALRWRDCGFTIESGDDIIHLAGKLTEPIDASLHRCLESLLEHAGNKRPHFWLLLQDGALRRQATNLVQEIQSNPQPHLAALAPNLQILSWSSLARPWLYQSTDNPETERVRQELIRRIDPRTSA
jgi:hypothetical protein